MTTRWLCLLVALLLLTPGDLSACCMIPKTYSGDVDQSAQQVVVFHHKGHQEMVIRVRPYLREFPKDASGNPEFPKYMEWVITVPSKPTKYALAKEEIFKEAVDLDTRLKNLASLQYRESMPMSNSAASLDNMMWKGLEVSEPINIGEYEITEVKALGLEALTSLNAYLNSRGYNEEDLDHMRWFVENNFTFLCIHITPDAGRSQLSERIELRPLQIGFASERPYYPGKFSSQQGPFALGLTLITSRPLERGRKEAMRNRLHAPQGWDPIWNLWTGKPLTGSLGDALAAGSFAALPEFWYVNHLQSAGFNHRDNLGTPAINHWQDDVHFDLGGARDLPPDYYYGDTGDSRRPAEYSPIASLDDIDWFRTGVLIALVAGLLALVAFVQIRRRATRES